MLAASIRGVTPSGRDGHHGGMDPDDLYGLPLDRFVSERNALARTLRADGRRKEAADVAGVRKPSVAAWAVNQLVRTQGRAMDGLFEAGDALRDAQADVLAGRGEARALRAAGERERAAVNGLVDAARGLLTSEGHELSAAVVDRVADTLHAAALDEAARAQVREGRLERDLRHVGLGLGDAAAVAPAPAAAKRKTPPKRAAARERTARARPERERQAERDRVARERADAQRIERERANARKAARAAEVTARRHAERAARALRVAEERRERAAQALADADETLATAREEAEAAEAANRRARDGLENA